MPSLVPTFVPNFSAHHVVSGSCSHVSLFLRFAGAAVVSFFLDLKPWLQQYPSLSMVVMSTGPVGIVVGRLGLFPVLTSFEVSVAMDDCASASFACAYPS